MMNNLLGLLFTMNLQASLLALVILLFRRVFKKTPRRYICLLWVLFVLRLLCPLSIESNVSPVPAISGDVFTDGVQAVQTGQTAQVAMDAPSAGSPENPVEPGEEEGAEALPPIIIRQLPQILIWAWAGGGVFFSLRCLYQYLRLRRAVRTAVRLEEGVYQCEGFRSPFVAGVFRPRIYIPFYIPAAEREPILRHEKMHIQNHDPLLYFLAMAVTCIHWWNPLVWYAAGRLKQDIEMRCDEAVLKTAAVRDKKAYSETLLRFAVRRNEPAATLKFGESLTENRIWYIFHAKEPPLFLKGAALFFIGLCAVVFATVSSSPLFALPRPQPSQSQYAGSSPLSAQMAENRREEPSLEPAVEQAEEPVQGKSGGAAIESAAAAAGKPEYQQTNADPSYDGACKFTQQITKFVAKGDAAGLSLYVHYPFAFTRDGVQTQVSSPKEFVRLYDEIMTESAKRDIFQADPSQLFTNWGGYMVGNGSVWFSQVPSGDYVITAINDLKETEQPAVK